MNGAGARRQAAQSAGRSRGRRASAWSTRLLFAATFSLLAVAVVEAQLELSVVSGRVIGPDGNPVRDAQVALLDPLGRTIQTVTSNGAGRFRLRSVPPGRYHVGAEAPALRSSSYRLSVGDGLPVEVELRLSPVISENLAVVAGTNDDSSSGTTLAGETVRRAATPLRGGALRAAVAATPGWTSEDNGLVHYRGVDDGLLFVLDGISVYERLDPQFGAGFDPLALGAVRVRSGYVPPEFGLRSGGVIEVRSQAGSIDSWSGVLEAAAGRHRAHALSGLVQVPTAQTASLTLALGGERSRRFLDPVSLDNLHNRGSTGGGEAEFIWAPGPSVLTLRGGHMRASFDVPHGREQERAGQDQRQEHERSFGTLNWQRSWSSAAVSQLALFGRFATGRLLGSPSDTPLSSEADRRQNRLGLLASIAYELGRHRLKSGVEASWIRLDESFRFFTADAEAGKKAGLSEGVLDHGSDDPFDFEGHVQRPIYSFYLQDSWRLLDRLTLDLGVRYDRSRLLLRESQWSPRLGVSTRLGRATFRVALNRFFQPPQTEHLLLSSSPQAHELSPFAGESAGGAEIRAERQTAAEVGCELWLGGGFRADAAVWLRRLRNQGDPNVFLGSTIVFPNSVDRGRAKGLDVRLELPRRGSLSGFVTYTLSRIEQFGPINGGLFLEDDIIEIGPGTKFTPDHDQRHALTAEISYEDDRRGLWVALGGRYRTGTPLEVSSESLAELAERPGADLADLDGGRVKPYAVFDAQACQRLVQGRRFEMSARVAILNLTNARYAFNFGNPFSGTHFGAPRSARLEVRLALR